MSRVTITITPITGLITRVITTHEPPSKGTLKGSGCLGLPGGLLRSLAAVAQPGGPRAPKTRRRAEPLGIGFRVLGFGL